MGGRGLPDQIGKMERVWIYIYRVCQSHRCTVEMMKSSKMELVAFFGICCFLQSNNLVHGHGNMVKPKAWWDKNQAGWNWDAKGRDQKIGCGVLNLPTDTEFNNETHKDGDCMEYWFSNDAEIPGNPTLPDKMSQPEVKCTGQGGNDDEKKHPWWAPGTAPVHGPCGTLGAMPNGCNNDGEGTFGDCCNNCGIFALGDNAENYLWPDMPISEWFSGEEEEVAWYVSANHAGGYSYRLCKMPEGGISDLTEECFQQNQLDFVGEEQWVQYAKDKKTGQRTELKAKQTTEGTFPAGSMWRANPMLPPKEEGGDKGYGHGHIIDFVKVPADLEPGEYVVSFR